MASISFYDSNSISTLFSGLNKSSSGNSMFNIDYNSYNSIRSGSYAKLLKSYYNKMDEESGDTTKVNKDKTSDAAKKTNATQARDAAASLVDASKDLRSSSLWNKVTVKDEEGNSKSDYDREKIFKAVGAFVDSYNSLVEKAGDSSDTAVLNHTSSLVNYTKNNAKLLKSVGVTIGTDNKLSVDKDTFNKADISTVKSVFSGSGSFAQSVSAKASSVYAATVSQLNELNMKNSYSSDGRYSYVNNSVYNFYT